MAAVKSLRAVAPKTVPVSIARGALLPATLIGALFAVFGSALGIPVGVSLLFGLIGGPISLLVHEFGHVSAARRVSGVRAARISLIWAGAATRFDGAYRSGRDQARVAIGGPEASFALAIACAGGMRLLPVPFALKGGLLLLAGFNVVLGLFNLLPANPLDGYKVIVGLLWQAVGSEKAARTILRRVGMTWLYIEIASVWLLIVEKPKLGIAVAVFGAAMYAQKRFVRRQRG